MNEWAVMWETLVNSGVPEADATRRVEAAKSAAQAETAQDWANMWERLVDAGVPEEGATQRVLKAQQSLSAPDRRAAAGQAVNNAMARGDTATARVVAEGYEADVPIERPAPAPVRRSAVSDTRMRGREEGREWSPIGAAGQGAGSMLFGVGTPATAAAKMITSAVPGGEPIMGPGEAMEYARGVREGAKEAHPVAYGVGAVGGLANAVNLTRNVVRSLPATARSVFSLQKGQTTRNILRMSAGGATAAGTTTALQEGVDAAGPAAAVGAVFGPAAGVATAGVVRGAQAVYSRIDPGSAAIRVLAKRLGESADAIADRYNEFIRVMGRAPRLIEIMRRETAEELGEISRSKVGTGAARVFREAEEEAALGRSGELSRQIERGGRTTTVPAEVAELAPIVDDAGRTVRSRVITTSAAQDRRQDIVMNRVMGRIGNHRVPLTDDMRDVVADPDVQAALPVALRRRVHNALEQGEMIGTVDLSVRTWEMMRQALAGKSGAGAGKIYSRLRDKVRDYVTDHVPEYGEALTEFGRRAETSAMTTRAAGAVSKDIREFADMIRIAREESPQFAPSISAGARVGVRKWLADQLSVSPQQADRVLRQLGRDSRLRANLRRTLSRHEMIELEALGERYGHRLNIIEGVKVGERVISGNAERFEDAVREVAKPRGGEIGVRTGARGTLAARAGESPGYAIGVARSLAENEGFQRRITAALGGAEAARLRQVGELTSTGARNLASATPRATQAQIERQAQAQQIQEIIAAGVAATGRASGALIANVLNNQQQRVRMSKGVAKKLAEMAVDPNRAHIYIARMRKAGVSEQELLRWYRDAAVAAGITVGDNAN